MISKIKIQEISKLKHPASKELENNEALVKRISLMLLGGWNFLLFFIACFATSLISERAKYDGHYPSDYRHFIYNIFGAELPVDPAENFFASPFITFLFIIAIAVLGSLVICMISMCLTANIRSKRFALDETFRATALIKCMAEEKAEEDIKDLSPNENQ